MYRNKVQQGVEAKSPSPTQNLVEESDIITEIIDEESETEFEAASQPVSIPDAPIPVCPPMIETDALSESPAPKAGISTRGDDAVLILSCSSDLFASEEIIYNLHQSLHYI